MHPTSLVSVIVIFFDAERFLEEAIESVAAQTYPHWELLLCDDGSTDGSTAIARRWADTSPASVRYLEHDNHRNRGMSATRNLGLAHARGEHVAWLDADDVWLPEKLERQVGLLEEHSGAAMVYGPLRVWFSWTGQAEDFRRDFTQELGVPADSLVEPPTLALRFLRDDAYIPSGVLVRRSVLEEVGGYEETIGDDYEDEIVHFKICHRWPVFASGESWVKYRQHENAFSVVEPRRPLRRKARANRIDYLTRLSEYLRSQGDEESEAGRLVRRELELAQSRFRYLVAGSASSGPRLVKARLQSAAREARELADRLVPSVVRRWVGLRACGRRRSPPPGWLHYGNLRRLTPISAASALDRGTPVDRYYVARFLAAHRADIRGRVLEVGNGTHGARPDGDDRVAQWETHPTMTQAARAEASSFDCVILADVLTAEWDVREAVRRSADALAPGGVILATLPAIVGPEQDGASPSHRFWRFTALSARRLFEEHFDPASLTVEVHGNVLAGMAVLHGISAEELDPRELEHADPDYATLIGVRAVKPPAANDTLSGS
jgi:glycosyltransferase involved in cell wall biosynthesis/SAM-dependent methyltransferase